MNEAQWSRFCGGLLEYIHNYYSKLVKTDYTIELNMSTESIVTELQQKQNIDELSEQLKEVAIQYKKTL